MGQEVTVAAALDEDGNTIECGSVLQAGQQQELIKPRRTSYHVPIQFSVSDEVQNLSLEQLTVLTRV